MADNKTVYTELMNELVDVINEKANASDSKNLEELVATAKTIVKPEGTLEITENKQYDVSGYAIANVNVASSGGGNTLKALLDFTKSSSHLFYNLQTITEIDCISFSDTSNVETMYNMYASCFKLKKTPLLDTSNVVVMTSMYAYCKVLKVVEFNDTSKLTTMLYIFNNCNALETVKGLNLINVTGNMSAFNDCYKLTNLEVFNIKLSITIGSGSIYGHLLTIESLLNTCQECINVSAARTLTVGSANITKLSSVYVKLTGEAEADANNPKLPMVQCESTDEGAMLVSDYMALKQWSLA